MRCDGLSHRFCPYRLALNADTKPQKKANVHLVETKINKAATHHDCLSGCRFVYKGVCLERRS